MLKAIRQEYITGETSKKNVPFWEYSEEWYRVKKEPHISPSSRKSYRVMLTKHILPQFGVKYLRAISAKQLQEFIQEGEYRGEEEPVRKAAEGAGSARDPISQGRQLSLISRSFGSGVFCCFGRKRIAVFAMLGYHMEGL